MAQIHESCKSRSYVLYNVISLEPKLFIPLYTPQLELNSKAAKSCYKIETKNELHCIENIHLTLHDPGSKNDLVTQMSKK